MRPKVHNDKDDVKEGGRPARSTRKGSSAASDVYKGQISKMSFGFLRSKHRIMLS